eukprot:c6255_g1_i2.p1 GENE.c6255_g1_i2~~c6255_g1_i2.p1  ORF type:complete len:104 (+),score=18.41 c6255_g1_i2:279-590(+)
MWMKELSLHNTTVHCQLQHPNLGQRMQHAFHQVFLQPEVTEAVIIGTDIPDLNEQVIVAAFQNLASNDIVFGDSGDGGYYLLGQRNKCHDQLFQSTITYGSGC